MANFDYEYPKLLKHEGGYVNNKNDAGGETYAGISRKYNPKWGGWTIIDRIKKEHGTKNINTILEKDVILQALVKDLYKKKYWDALKLDEARSQTIASEMFDTCVNMGQAQAIKNIEYAFGFPITGKLSDKLLNKLKHG